MAITFNYTEKETVEFEDFIKIIDSKIKNNTDIDGLLDCSYELYKLSNNEHFITDFINKGILNLEEFQKRNNYSGQSWVLFRNEKFLVRVNYWPILNINNKYYDKEYSYFSYGLCHDHNFPFLTVGYTEFGYETKIWEYNYDSVKGIENEAVEIKFLENTYLNKGKVLYFRPSQDIHTQYQPNKENSISINIMLDYKLRNKQYEFDIENERIKKVLYDPYGKIKTIFNMFIEFGDNEINEELLKISINHEDDEIRAISKNLLNKIENY